MKSLPSLQTKIADQRLSEIVRALRFPLILIVVFIHVPLASSEGQVLPFGLPGDAYPWYQYISQMISFTIGDMAVPMFFLFSGYYMFNKMKTWGRKTIYVEETKKRWKTLIIPYIIWCVFALFANQSLMLAKGEDLPWIDISSSLHRLLYTFVLGPENFPLWYVRDLIILAFLAPVVDWISRRIPWLLLLLFLIYLINWHLWEIPSLRGIIYFTLGAIFGTSCLYIGGWIYERQPKLHRLHLRMEKYVFFVYVAHEVLILSAVRGFFYRHGYLETVWGYFLCGTTVLGICLFLYEVLSRLARQPLTFSLGGRS